MVNIKKPYLHQAPMNHLASKTFCPLTLKIQQEHNQHLKLLGLNSEYIIARVYFMEIVYSFKTLKKRAVLAFLSAVLSERVISSSSFP